MDTVAPIAPSALPSLTARDFSRRGLVCAIAGALGGVGLMWAGHATIVTGPALGLFYGVLFAFLLGREASSVGSELLWGFGYALLLWIVLVIAFHNPSRTNRDNFPDLVGYILCFGATLGCFAWASSCLFCLPDLRIQ